MGTTVQMFEVSLKQKVTVLLNILLWTKSLFSGQEEVFSGETNLLPITEKQKRLMKRRESILSFGRISVYIVIELNILTLAVWSSLLWKVQTSQTLELLRPTFSLNLTSAIYCTIVTTVSFHKHSILFKLCNGGIQLQYKNPVGVTVSVITDASVLF